MSDEREAAKEWYAQAHWGNEDFKTAVLRGYEAGAEWQRSQEQAELAALKAKSAVPEGLLDRIDSAITAFTSGRASMHVPPEANDVDMVLAECWKMVKSMLAAAPAQPQSDGVIVPRELLYRIKNVYAAGLTMDSEMDEIRALLGGDQPAQQPEDPLEWSRKHGIEEF